MRVAGSSVGAGSGNEGNKAMKDGGMIRDLFPGAGFSGSRTRPQLNTHQVSLEHAPGFSAAGTWLQRCGWGWCAQATAGHIIYAGCIRVHKLTAYRGSTQTQEAAVNGQPYQIV